MSPNERTPIGSMPNLSDKDTMILVRGYHVTIARMLEAKANEFIESRPIETENLRTAASETILGEVMNQILDRDDWTRHDVLELASAAFLMAIGLEEPSEKR